MSDVLVAELEATARGLGAVGFGIAATDPFDDVRSTMNARLASGESADLPFTYKDVDRATSIRSSFPDARSLVSVAWPYVPAAGSPPDARPGMGRIARFAETDHYAGLRSVLDALVEALESAGHAAEGLADDDRLVDRAIAVRAGVGWWGKSTMVLVPGAGPWVLLGSVVTDAALAPSSTSGRDCGACERCLPACPTGALVAPGSIDARLCISYRAQAPGVIPRAMRAAMGDRLYGCDDCLTACPPGHPALAAVVEERGSVDLVEVLEADDATLLDRFGHFFMPGRRPRHLRRNALVVLGNVGGQEAFAVVVGYLGHPDWLLRLHAAWALGRLADPRATVVARVALEEERHEAVREELEMLCGSEAASGLR